MSSVPVIPQARGLRHTGPVTVAVVSGPTAVGKGTVVGALLRSHPEIVVSRSVTTRPPRPTERDGIDYDFITPEQFDKLVDGEGLLEWATVHNSHRYGTPRGPVERAVADNRTVVLEIDLQGARQVRETYPQATQIFLAPPSWEELERSGSPEDRFRELGELPADRFPARPCDCQQLPVQQDRAVCRTGGCYGRLPTQGDPRRQRACRTAQG